MPNAENPSPPRPPLTADQAASAVVGDLSQKNIDGDKRALLAAGVVDKFWEQHHLDQNFNDEWNDLQSKINSTEKAALVKDPAVSAMFGDFQIVTKEVNGKIEDIKVGNMTSGNYDEISPDKPNGSQIQKNRSKPGHHHRGIKPEGPQGSSPLDPDDDGDIDGIDGGFINPIKPRPRNNGTIDDPGSPMTLQ